MPNRDISPRAHELTEQYRRQAQEMKVQSIEQKHREALQKIEMQNEQRKLKAQLEKAEFLRKHFNDEMAKELKRAHKEQKKTRKSGDY